MGCGGAKGTGGTDVEKERRRLSVGNVDAKEDDKGAAVTEEDRGLITSLNNASIVEMIGDEGQGRKMSIGSQTDQTKTSFANKSIQQAGDEIDATSIGLGYTCRKGLKPESPNQDSWFVLKFEGNYSIYAVFDGHGQKGHDISNFVKENLPKLLVKDNRFKTPEMPKLLVETFKKTQALISSADRMKKLQAQMSGTTATVCVHDHGKNKITMAHVADSTAVLGKKKAGGQNELEGVQLTRDHKPNLKDERARIEKNGGRVVFDGYANHRIYAKNARYPGLNMSRCLGDLMGHQDCGITAEPDIVEKEIAAEDEILLLCSDGVWEFITAEEAVKIVWNFEPSKAMAAAEKLAKEAWDRWIKEEGGAVVDDITVIVVFLQHSNAKA